MYNFQLKMEISKEQCNRKKLQGGAYNFCDFERFRVILTTAYPEAPFDAVIGPPHLHGQLHNPLWSSHDYIPDLCLRKRTIYRQV